ncbi:MauE/DoxX family redox-associated membrane protein [Pedobacter psychroterrae]|uniref:DoxX family membrane protein n=1 Tax=Pedobacter psychroterrae TaxID=2530453 RepID=A0A4R0NQ71_9SPHI|nr:MauE/DoxX family redox-associated membrane protein [Pedobacter psychroterrae]TCD03161.1 DoxX family membrane protein [Pedobacter psychroterrae]
MNPRFLQIMPQVTAWIFIVLFVYTASDKLVNVKDFSEFLNRLEFIGPYGSVLAWMIPVVEIGISLMLLLPSFRAAGLIVSIGLMLLFTFYLVYMRIAYTHLPCHCGGVISKLTWLQHIWFNVGLIVLLLFSVRWFSWTKPAG